MPLIFREVAYKLFVDTLDMRVYSARRGRMWRAPGVQRENGKFKVPLTKDEAFNMRVKDYAVVRVGVGDTRHDITGAGR